jgi:O-antigen ligase
MIYTALLIILFTTFAFLAWHNFRAGLILFCGLFPTYLLRFSLGPLPTTALEIFFLILFTIWLFKKSFLPNQPLGLTNAKGWLLAIIVLLATAFFAAAHAPNIFTALGILKAYYLEPLILIAILLTTLRKHEDWFATFTSLATSAIIIALLGILQYLTGLGIPIAWLAEHRITSVFDFPNAIGLFLAPILSMLIIFLTSLPKLSFGRKQKIELSSTLIVSIILLLITIVLAKTEAALIAIPTAIFITLLFSNAKRTTKLVSTALVVIVIIGVFSLPSIKSKILLQDISGQARTESWHETLTMLSDYPIQGAGLSGFPTVIAPYHDASYFEVFQYPHNIFLNIWVELGLPGLLAFLIFSFLILKVLLPTKAQPWSQTPKPAELARLLLLAAFLTISFHGLVDVPFFKNDIAMLTALFLAATIYISNQQTKA